MTLLTLTPITRETPTQRAVLDTADVLFTAHGVIPVTLEDVAAQAELPLHEVIEAYPTKQAIVIAVLQRWHGSWRRALDRLAEMAGDPRDEVLGIFTYLEACFEDEGWRGCAFINGHAELGRQDPDIAALAREHFLDVERHLTLVCKRGGMPAHIAQGLALLVEGARVESAVQQSAQPARSARLTAAMLMSVYDSRPTF